MADYILLRSCSTHKGLEQGVLMTPFTDSTWLYEDTILIELNRPNAKLETVECYDTEIRGAKLGGSTLTRWIFEDCRFTHCDLSNVQFDDVVLQNCHFEDCRLLGIDWRGAKTLNLEVSFTQCQLSLSNFSGMVLKGLHLKNSDCSDVDFTQANLEGADFENSSLKNVLFDETRLNSADLSYAHDVFIDPENNAVKGLKLSVTAAVSMARRFGIEVPNALP
jgi:fluoroquinolone resistance protein